MISKSLTSRWTTQQVQFIAELLDELQESLWENYNQELTEFYRWKDHEEQEKYEEQLSAPFDIELPF